LPRSPLAPEPPPTPTASEIMQQEVARIKRLLGLDINRLAIGSDIEGLVSSPFGIADYTITGVNVIEFVDVSTSIGPAQGSSTAPAQVTGLTVTPQAGSNTQLNLAWTAITAPDFNYYNVYRGMTSGFTVGPSSEIAQPVTNSYNNTGLTPGTTYYYRVSTTNDAELEGAPSSQVSATTTGTPPSFLMHLDNNYIDSSANATPPYAYPPFASYTPNGFGTPGKFGSHYWRCNTPVYLPGPFGGYPDQIGWYGTAGVPTPLEIDYTVGFSWSLWIYPTDISALPKRRNLVVNIIDDNNVATIQIDPTGVVLFAVRKAGATIRRQIGGLVINQWQHIAAVYDGVANTVRIYRNAVEGAGSSLTPDYPTGKTDELRFGLSPGAVGEDSYYEGYMDEIQYFKGYRLSAGEVTNLMNTNST